MPLRLSGSCLDPAIRDGIAGFLERTDTPPTIVSISDIHGQHAAAKSALRTLDDHPDYAPVVVADEAGRLHWADENYVLVFNGDLIDRGPANEAVLEMVSRLSREARPGRVRLTLGNHEAMMLSPERWEFTGWYSSSLSSAERDTFIAQLCSGQAIAAYEGYSVTYVHAGSPEPYDVGAVNDSLVAAAKRVADGRLAPAEMMSACPKSLGPGRQHPKGADGGLVWIGLRHLPPDAPRQVVGHTRQDAPRRKGNVYCQDVIQNTIDSPGGEGVFVETPESMTWLERAPDGGVDVVPFS